MLTLNESKANRMKVKKQRNLQIIGFVIILLTTGCLNTKLKLHKKYPKEIISLKLDKEDIKLIEEKEPALIPEIVTFRKTKNNEKLEIQTVQDFIGLQRCENQFRCKYKDFPNEFLTIFDFYQKIEKSKYKWIQKKENRALKNSLLKFLTNHPNETDAMEHTIQQLSNMIIDPDYVKLIYDTSIYPPKPKN